MAASSKDNSGKEAVSTILLTETREVTELLNGIVHATTVHTTEGDDFSKGASTLKDEIENLDLFVSDKMFCSYCNATFIDREEQTSHYKTDWHRFNLKQKLRNARHVSVEEFEEMTGDISSISGSDSDSSDSEELLSRKVDSDNEGESSGHIEGIGKRHPRVFFRNKNGQLLSIYRCVIHGRRNQPATLDDLVSLSAELPSQVTWTVLLTAGGHFAGAVFERGEMIAHKTFHRYVVRAKRGTAQSARDAQGNAPKSAGANLRRYNEAALTQEVQDLLVTWTDNLKASDRIFIRVPSYNKTIYYSGRNSPIQKDDARIRMIPFSTRRPTMKEAKRVHDILATIECYGSDTDLSDHIKKSPAKQFQKPIAKPTPRQALSKKKKKVRQTDFSDESSSDTDLEGEDLVLGFQQEITDTVDLLKPFDVTKNPKRRKRKDKPGPNKPNHEKIGKEDVEFTRVRNALYTACKVGDLESLNSILKDLEESENFKSNVVQSAEKDQNDVKKDTSDITVCDSIRTGEVKHLGDGDAVKAPGICERKANTTEILNKPFGNQESTLLHIAATESHKPIIYRLLEAGADPAIKDMCGQVPYNCAKTKDVRGEFRTFMRSYPDKYDYVLAQVPTPMSAEKEAEKKAKEAEKRKAQRKAKREKQKVQREEDNKKRAEEKEKERYLALSDREKRALAAEKRLASQITSSGGAAPVLSRCFQCATDITGKVPFEYYDFKFCTTKCLREHKAKTSSQSGKS